MMPVAEAGGGCRRLKPGTPADRCALPVFGSPAAPAARGCPGGRPSLDGAALLFQALQSGFDVAGAVPGPGSCSAGRVRLYFLSAAFFNLTEFIFSAFPSSAFCIPLFQLCLRISLVLYCALCLSFVLPLRLSFACVPHLALSCTLLSLPVCFFINFSCIRFIKLFLAVAYVS